MGLTPRTLQRRLKDESTSFQSLYDLRRQQVAQDHLQRDTDVETIAAMLGYSDPANFYRAFKAWTGVSPSEFRKRRSA
jgi:AraC-like DNA-binding protein